MTASVGIFFHSALIAAPTVVGSSKTDDTVLLLKQPPLARDLLSCTSSDADTSDAAPAGTQIAYVQVQQGKRVYYEVTPAGHTPRAPDSGSPILEGNTILQCGPGWQIAAREVA